MRGKVYLVGAGPGDPELLTRRAWRVLQFAEIILHDDLVSREILDALPGSAQIVNVGKRCGMEHLSQQEINDRMVLAAREGQIVARLKSGDPLIFGRAGEEMAALRAAGIDFEIVPGVTSALGAAASAQISLTDRRHASRVVFVTAHRSGGSGLTNEHDVAADTTYVIFMPGHRYDELSAELKAAGISLDVPCAVISRATLPDQAIFWTTVGGLGACTLAEAPSLLIVGAVAAAPTVAAPGDGLSSSERSSKLLSLAMLHPLHDFSGGPGGE